MSKVVASDYNFIPYEEEMAFPTLSFTRLFKNKKTPSGGFIKDTSSRKDSWYCKKKDSKDESNRQLDRKFMH